MPKKDTELLKEILKVLEENLIVQTEGFNKLEKWIIAWKEEDAGNHKREEENFDRRKDKYDEIINLIKDLKKQEE